MFKIHRLEKDTTIYQHAPDKNTGADPILELIKNASGQIIPSQINPLESWPTSTSSRILMKFPDTTYDESYLYQLLLHTLELQNASSQIINIKIYPLLIDWVEGVGNTNDAPYVNRGASWSSYNSNDIWPDPMYDESIEISYEYNLTENDLFIDISEIVEYWNLNPNHGIIIKYDDAFEIIDYDNSAIKFFGKNTHTIWDPTLVVSMPISDGEFSPSTDLDPYKIDLSISNFKSKFERGEHVIFNINVRALFDKKSYVSTSSSLSDITLPTTQYQIEDSHTGKIIVPYNSVNTINKSDVGYYVSFTTDNFYSNRFYKIKFKLISPDGNMYIKDHNYNFKIV